MIERLVFHKGEPGFLGQCHVVLNDGREGIMDLKTCKNEPKSCLYAERFVKGYLLKSGVPLRVAEPQSNAIVAVLSS